MTTLYLITGFLGAGKTSFLHNFIRFFDGQSIHVIVNEFGKVGVDGKLLSSIDASLSEITGGSIFCSCRSDQFESALKDAVHGSPEIILVEASGLSDPTSIRKMLWSEEWKEKTHYGGCLCLADATTLPKVYATARVIKKQLSVADIIFLNKTDIATEEQIVASKAIINSQRPDIAVLETSFGRIPDGWNGIITLDENVEQNSIKTADINLHKISIKVSEDFSPFELIKFLEMFAEDTYRIKGFVKLKGETFIANCVGSLVKLEPYEENIDTDNIIVVLYGYGLPAKKSITKATKWYPDKVLYID